MPLGSSAGLAQLKTHFSISTTPLKIVAAEFDVKAQLVNYYERGFGIKTGVAAQLKAAQAFGCVDEQAQGRE
jgi:hypothetical protein